MLFVLAGYGGSLHEPWVNGVWGETTQKWNSPHALRKKDLLQQKGINKGSEYEAAMKSEIKLSL